MRIRWSKTALADLKQIAEYIAEGNPAAARRVVSEIRKQVDVLANHPYLGRPGRTEGTRELIVSKYPYVVAYEVAGRTIVLLAVVHTSRLCGRKVFLRSDSYVGGYRWSRFDVKNCQGGFKDNSSLFPALAAVDDGIRLVLSL